MTAEGFYDMTIDARGDAAPPGFLAGVNEVALDEVESTNAEALALLERERSPRSSGLAARRLDEAATAAHGSPRTATSSGVFYCDRSRTGRTFPNYLMSPVSLCMPRCVRTSTSESR
jgi:hypothetical protein